MAFVTNSVVFEGFSTQYAVDAPGICASRINASINIRQLKPMCIVETINWAVAVVNRKLHQRSQYVISIFYQRRHQDSWDFVFLPIRTCRQERYMTILFANTWAFNWTWVDVIRPPTWFLWQQYVTFQKYKGRYTIPYTRVALSLPTKLAIEGERSFIGYSAAELTEGEEHDKASLKLLYFTIIFLPTLARASVMEWHMLLLWGSRGSEVVVPSCVAVILILGLVSPLIDFNVNVTQILTWTCWQQSMVFYWCAKLALWYFFVLFVNHILLQKLQK